MARPPRQSNQQSYTGTPPAVPSHVIVKDWPTPALDDRILVIRKDMHAPGFEMPESGSPVAEREADEYEGFMFATSKAADQQGWIDLYYVNERENQDDYNYTVEFPYVDKDYPRITRTYVTLREGATELQADTLDPVFGSPYYLTDHKWVRHQDPVLDALFIGQQRTYDKLPSPAIESHEMNQYQQDVTIIKQEMVSSALPTPTALTELDKVERTGTAKCLVTVGTVDEVFPAEHYQTDRTEHAIPFKFRSKVPGRMVETTQAGTASQPVLSQSEWTGDEQQLTEFKYKSSRTTHPLGTAGFVSTLEYVITNDQQLATITDTWKNTTQVLTPTALLVEGKIDELGNGDTIKSETTVAAVFDKKATEREIADLVPQIFKAVLPVDTVETSAADTTVDDPPTLGTGDLRKREVRETEFRVRTITTGRGSIGYPQTATASQQLSGMEFGGEHLRTVAYLNDSLPTVEEGLGVTKSQVTNLGNGTWVRETEKFDTGVTAWPTLVGTEVDPRTGIAVGIEKKVVDAGTEGGVTGTQFIDVKPIDKWRSIQITSTLDPDTLPDTVQWETTAEYSFPNVLQDVEWLWVAAASGDCCYSFDMALETDIQQGYAGPCRALITESFTVGPPGDTVGITQWFPQGHSIGYSWAYANGDCDVCSAQAKTWQIPPTLHDTITIAGGVTLDNGVFTSTLPATCPIGLPAADTLITKSVDVERWRFGVFYRRVTQIYVPDSSC